MSRGRVAPTGPPKGPPGDDRGCTVLHVDMDAFYASVELRSRPELRGLPVIVGGGGSRGVVLSATYEARRHGVASAMPMMRARRLCPSAVVLAPDHRAYADVSAGVMEVFRSVTPLVEPLSLDEAFLEVSGAARRLGGARAVGEWIRATVQDEQGITCSVGVASTKFVAKLASARCKPDGLLVVPADGAVAFLHPLPVAALWGVGEKTEEVLLRLGLRTVGDIAHTPLATLQRALGPATGAHLSALSWGRDERRVVPVEPDKSIGAEETFARRRRRPGGHRPGAAPAVRADRRPAARDRAGRPDHHDQGPVQRLHHSHPVPDAARGHRRRAHRVRDRARALRPRSASSAPGCAWSGCGSRGSGPGRASSTSCCSASGTPGGARPSRPWTGRPAASAPEPSARPPSCSRPTCRRAVRRGRRDAVRGRPGPTRPGPAEDSP